MWECKTAQLLGQTAGYFLKESDTALLCVSTIPVRGIFPRNFKVCAHKETWS